MFYPLPEKLWGAMDTKIGNHVCVSAVLRILLLLPTSQLFTVFAHKRKTRCQLMLHNSKTVRILYENTHIFEKLMNSAFKQNQVWYNQMSQSWNIMYSGEHESSRIGLIFDWTAGKGWNKKNSNSDQFPYYFTAAYSKSFPFSTHGTTFQFILLHSIQFLTLSNLLILILPQIDASVGLCPHFCFRWLVFTLLLPSFFAILPRTKKKGDHRPRNSAQYERVVELLIMHKAKWTPRQIPLLPSVSQPRSNIRQLRKERCTR